MQAISSATETVWRDPSSTTQYAVRTLECGYPVHGTIKSCRIYYVDTLAVLTILSNYIDKCMNMFICGFDTERNQDQTIQTMQFAFLPVDAKSALTSRTMPSPADAKMVDCNTVAIVIHWSKIDYKESPELPNRVQSWLKSKQLYKCGVGIEDDANYIKNQFEINMHRLLDLDALVPLLYPELSKQTSLHNIAMHCLHWSLSKNGTHKWSPKVLSDSDILYAGLDAVASLELGNELLVKHFTNTGAHTAVQNTNQPASMTLTKDEELVLTSFKRGPPLSRKTLKLINAVYNSEILGPRINETKDKVTKAVTGLKQKGCLSFLAD